MAEYKRKRKEDPPAVAMAAAETGNTPPFAPEMEEAVIGAMMVELAVNAAGVGCSCRL